VEICVTSVPFCQGFESRIAEVARILRFVILISSFKVEVAKFSSNIDLFTSNLCISLQDVGFKVPLQRVVVHFDLLNHLHGEGDGYIPIFLL
jgi:hypothetical protein